jgi:hypothetical protein
VDECSRFREPLKYSKFQRLNFVGEARIQSFDAS